MKLYLLSEICLLADVLKIFLNNFLNKYQLDPAYFLSAPHLEWKFSLEHINQSIPLITDPEMYPTIHPNIRGGICHASVRFARANNKLMGSLHNPTQLTSYIMGVDANNLSHEMPDGDFEWMILNKFLEMTLLLNNADGRIAIFDLCIFKHRMTDEVKNSFMNIEPRSAARSSTTCARSTSVPRISSVDS